MLVPDLLLLLSCVTVHKESLTSLLDRRSRMKTSLWPLGIYEDFYKHFDIYWLSLQINSPCLTSQTALLKNNTHKTGEHTPTCVSLAHPPTSQLVFVQTISQIPHREQQCSCLLWAPRQVLTAIYRLLLVQIRQYSCCVSLTGRHDIKKQIADTHTGLLINLFVSYITVSAR